MFIFIKYSLFARPRAESFLYKITFNPHNDLLLHFSDEEIKTKNRQNQNANLDLFDPETFAPRDDVIPFMCELGGTVNLKSGALVSI